MTSGRTPIDYTIELTKNLCPRDLTHEQVEFICSILDPLAAMDPQQHAAMVAEKVYREHMMEDDPRFHARYQVMVGQIHEEGPFVQIARTVGQYTWYDIEGNHFFWAEPEFRMTENL